MKVGICHTKGGADSQRIIEAFSHGVIAQGDEVRHLISAQDITYIQEQDVLICICYPSPTAAFRLAIHHEARRAKKRIIYIDAGCMRFDKFELEKNYYQIGFDCIKNYGKYYNSGMPSDRFLKLSLPIHPWREASIKNVVLIGQNPNGVTSQNFNIEQWFHTDIIPRLTQGYVYLNHPNTNLGRQVKNTKIEDALKNSTSCIAWNSNALIEFIRHGIPTAVFSPGGMAFELCPHDISSLGEGFNYFDRTPLFNDLAYTQWSVQEMADGLPWNHLKPHIRKIEDVDYSNCFLSQ
jgi:hypothetical protein